jgi:nicotinamide-nucleotide amidase
VPAIDRELDRAVESLAAALAPWVFSTDGRSLEAVVGDGLRARGWTIAAAESCTAGLLLARLTDVPGSSAWVLGGSVVYADDAKIRELGVTAQALRDHGAVSEAVARAMAEGVKARFGASVGVAITGIAGPSGGSPAKPVGTVVVAVAAAETVVRTYRFPGDRAAVRQHSTAAALELVRRLLA